MNDRTPTTRPKNADARPTHTRFLVLQAARMIMLAEGQAAVTPTRLVEVSGVARSTIYRHWPDPSSIIAEAADHQDDLVATGKTGDVESDLRAQLKQLAQRLESPGASIIVAQAEVAERDERALAIMAANGASRGESLAELIGRGGEDYDAFQAQLVGPLFMQRFFLRRPITNELIDQIVSTYLLSRENAEP